MMSEVYVELIRSIDRYDVELPFIPWFNGLIVRQVRNWNRSIWRRFRLLERVKEKGYEAPVAGMEDKLGDIDPALDSKIERIAKNELAGKWRLHKGTRFRPKLVHAAAAFALLTGFGYATHSLLYKISEGSVRMEVQARKDFTLTQITPEEVRLELANVENKLATGETALVYFAALEKEEHPLFQQNPMIGIEKPDVVKDWSMDYSPQ
ncbi:hypothetical protein [Brevibacillus antibioticus]|uniref:hypothetical protein n=1 Tax=Brevibacillus antibioticus TaxID=2570228 RepID=UPI001FCB77E6|nr:hypothetical protein [Brevibacillus antibioticus]